MNPNGVVPTESAEERAQRLSAPINHETWRKLVDVARHCPSPHNVQPWIIQVLDGGKAHLCISGSRTFPDTDRTGSFIISALAMFAWTLKQTAANAGFELDVILSDLDSLELQSPLSIYAQLELRHQPELSPSQFTDQALISRKTSRKPNHKKPVPEALTEKIQKIAESFGQTIVTTTDQETISRNLDRNIMALFTEMNDPHYFGELKPLLHLGRSEAHQDGLNAAIMNLSQVQWAVFKNFPQLVQVPILTKAIGTTYRSQLGHCQELAFVSGKFWDRNDAVESGEMLIQIWIALSEENVFIHPFGNLVTHQESRANVEREMGICDLWFVFRYGYTDDPLNANRLPVESILEFVEA